MRLIIYPENSEGAAFHQIAGTLMKNTRINFSVCEMCLKINWQSIFWFFPNTNVWEIFWVIWPNQTRAISSPKRRNKNHSQRPQQTESSGRESWAPATSLLAKMQVRGGADTPPRHLLGNANRSHHTLGNNFNILQALYLCTPALSSENSRWMQEMDTDWTEPTAQFHAHVHGHMQQTPRRIPVSAQRALSLTCPHAVTVIFRFQITLLPHLPIIHGPAQHSHKQTEDLLQVKDSIYYSISVFLNHIFCVPFSLGSCGLSMCHWWHFQYNVPYPAFP